MYRGNRFLILQRLVILKLPRSGLVLQCEIHMNFIDMSIAYSGSINRLIHFPWRLFPYQIRDRKEKIFYSILLYGNDVDMLLKSHSQGGMSGV